MTKYFREIIFLLGKEIFKIPWIVILSSIAALFEIIGLGLVIPYVSLLLEDGELYQYLIFILTNYLGFLGLSTEKQSILVYLGLLLIFTFLLKTVLSLKIYSLVISFCQNQQYRLKVHLMRTYQKLPYEVYIRKNSSEYVYQTVALTNQFANTVLQPMLKIMSEGIIAVLIIVLLLVKEPFVLFSMSILFASIIFLFDLLFKKKLDESGKKANLSNEIIVKTVNENFSGFKELRVLGKENFFFNRLKLNSRIFVDLSKFTQTIAQFPRYIIEFFAILFIVSLIFVLVFNNKDLVDIVPTVALFGVASIRLLPMFNTFSQGIIQLRYSRNSVSKLFNELNNLTNINPSNLIKLKENKKVDVREKFEKLALCNVSFSYETASKTTIKGISLSVKANEMIGIIGPSGSGKTTLIDIMLGLLKPTDGHIEINDRKIYSLNDSSEIKIGYLPQKVFITDDTLAHNIAMGIDAQDIDYDLVKESIKKAKLEELVSSLKDGINSKLGEDGVRLSGGQKQRVALARSFYFKNDLLILDESTSNIDDKIESEIISEINNLKDNISVIIIAHRFKTIKYCDTVFRIENGKIAFKGSVDKIKEKYFIEE